MVDYTVHSRKDRKKILKYLGIDSKEDIFDFLPGKIRDPVINIPEGLDERSLREKLEAIGSQNNPVSGLSSFLGGGAYDHYVPAVVEYITSISQFFTAYTPYQAEISQGTLEYIFEFQSLICQLTGMDISNASTYDGASSLAEAVLMASRINGRKKVVMPVTINPQYRDTVKSYVYGLDMDIREVGYKDGVTDLSSLEKEIDENTSAVLIQNPNYFGCYEEVFKIKKIMEAYPDCLYIICVNPLSLALIKPPSEYGADIVVGDGQVFGNTLSMGGPYLGFFSARQKYLRQLPGRIVGKTIDAGGKDAYVLTFQTREQHIRKKKATSNICSNHSLNALAFTAYLMYAGEKGLKETALDCVKKAAYFADRLKETAHFKIRFKSSFFNELVVASDLDVEDVLGRLREKKILGGIRLGTYYPELADSMLVSFTEVNTWEEIDRYIDILKGI
jgi:glycine dehydrogenase subunit 1